MTLTFQLALAEIEKEVQVQKCLETKKLKIIWNDLSSAVKNEQKQVIERKVQEFEKEIKKLANFRLVDLQKHIPKYWLAKEIMTKYEFRVLETDGGTVTEEMESKGHFSTSSSANIILQKINHLIDVLKIDMATTPEQNDFESCIQKLNSIQDTVAGMPRQITELLSLLPQLSDVKTRITEGEHCSDQEANNNAPTDVKINQIKSITNEIWSTIAKRTQKGPGDASCEPNDRRDVSGRINGDVDRSANQKRTEMVSNPNRADDSRDVMIRKLQEEIASLQEKERTLNSALQSMEADKNYWMARMSELSGTKIKDNNPSITDLSDANRPQKLAEKFGELYDNEWTEALEKLTTLASMAEKESTELLVMVECYAKCEKYANNQIKEIEKQLLLTAVQPSRTEKKKKEIEELGSDVISCRKALRDAQKAVSSTAGIFMRKEISKVPLSGITKKQAKLTANFIESSIEICWGMVVHDPPLVFLCPENKKQKIDFDSFTLYTQSGNVLEFIVWPALLLFKDGPVLKKGVAQPICKKK